MLRKYLCNGVRRCNSRRPLRPGSAPTWRAGILALLHRRAAQHIRTGTPGSPWHSPRTSSGSTSPRPTSMGPHARPARRSASPTTRPAWPPAPTWRCGSGSSGTSPVSVQRRLTPTAGSVRRCGSVRRGERGRAAAVDPGDRPDGQPDAAGVAARAGSGRRRPTGRPRRPGAVRPGQRHVAGWPAHPGRPGRGPTSPASQATAHPTAELARRMLNHRGHRNPPRLGALPQGKPRTARAATHDAGFAHHPRPDQPSDGALRTEKNQRR
jgi:hypothetical protein